MCAVDVCYLHTSRCTIQFYPQSNSGFAEHEELTNPNHVHDQNRLSANLSFHELLMFSPVRMARVFHRRNGHDRLQTHVQITGTTP